MPMDDWRKMASCGPSSPLGNGRLPVSFLLRCSPLSSILQDQTAAHDDFEVVEWILDGDTLVLASGERVRLIGVDTPETKHPKKPVERFGKEASEFSRQIYSRFCFWAGPP
jgi:endonuclease YncB( thermonuclease family)